MHAPKFVIEVHSPVMGSFHSSHGGKLSVLYSHTHTHTHLCHSLVVMVKRSFLMAARDDKIMCSAVPSCRFSIKLARKILIVSLTSLLNEYGLIVPECVLPIGVINPGSIF